jgi:aspartyl/asparaginyl beta-hydroxylase (cupin superfamily)
MTSAEVNHRLNEAMRARQAGRLADARRHFESVLEAEPTNPVARNVLGLDAIALGDIEEGAAHLEQACRGDPNAAELWLNLASARARLSQPEAEREALERALNVDQRFLPALIRLAEIHETSGDEAAATERWTAVIALATPMAQSSPELARLLLRARSFVEGQRLRLAESLDSALTNELAAASAQEQRRARAAADVMLGRRRLYVNECHGLHYPFLPSDEYFDREHFPWLQDLEAANGVIRAELEGILADQGGGFEPYVAQPSGVPDNKWSPLNRSLDWGALHLWRDGERNDEACRRAPQTAALVESLPLCRIPGRAPAVFFSILRAGKHIPPHTGVTNVRSIVHLPLIVPEGCTFRVGGDTRAWVEGEAFVFDDTIEHEADNPTDRDRAVLILDCWNPYLSEAERAAVRCMYEASDAHRTAATSASVTMRAD